jgi:hypothetical protein
MSALHAASGRQRPTRAVGAGARAGFERAAELVAWPRNPADAWRKGFLAGTFDAAGSGGEVLRIGIADDVTLHWIRSCTDAFGLATDLERRASNGLPVVRLRGGLRERLRFSHLVDPAIRRRLDIDGMALESDGRTRLVSIEPLERMLRMYDITTGTGDFVANGVVSHNCFARPTHTYLGFDAGRDFEREIVVKVNAPEVVRAELRRPSWRGEHVALVFCPACSGSLCSRLRVPRTGGRSFCPDSIRCCCLAARPDGLLETGGATARRGGVLDGPRRVLRARTAVRRLPSVPAA